MADEVKRPHPVYSTQHTGRRGHSTCPHTYLDAQNICLDCNKFVESAGSRDEDLELAERDEE